MQTHASEPGDVQLGEEQQAVHQEPEEEDEVHHVWLLDELGQRVALQAGALLQCGFARVAGLPAGARHRQGCHKRDPGGADPARSPYVNIAAQLES